MQQKCPFCVCLMTQIMLTPGALNDIREPGIRFNQIKAAAPMGRDSFWKESAAVDWLSAFELIIVAWERKLPSVAPWAQATRMAHGIWSRVSMHEMFSKPSTVEGNLSHLFGPLENLYLFIFCFVNVSPILSLDMIIGLISMRSTKGVYWPWYTILVWDVFWVCCGVLLCFSINKCVAGIGIFHRGASKSEYWLCHSALNFIFPQEPRYNFIR